MHSSLALALVPLLQADVTAWTEDALHFVQELEHLHPDPYFGCPREEFERAVDGFLDALEQQNPDEQMVGFLRLVARVSEKGRDGHTGAWPMSAHVLPFQVYGFPDGWFVVQADEPALVGARLVALGGVPIAEACERLGQVLTADNEWNRRLKTGLALITTEILHGVGLAEDATHVRVTLEQAGRSEERVFTGASVHPMQLGHQPLPAKAGVPWLTDRDQSFRYQVFEPERALYVQYNEVVAQSSAGKALSDFSRELVETFEHRALAKLIIDVRSNGGGDNTTFGPLIAALETPAINRPGVLFCLIGRATFSAAGSFVTVLERSTKVILVGEPTGGAPNQYGDAREVALPHHRDVLVRVSTIYHHLSKPDDPRLTHEPHLAVPLTSADYFAGRDLVLCAALDYQPPR